MMIVIMMTMTIMIMMMIGCMPMMAELCPTSSSKLWRANPSQSTVLGSRPGTFTAGIEKGF